MTRVFISPQPAQIPDDNGVGRVIHALAKYLPAHGVELVADEASAEVTAAHITKGALKALDALHLHGLYWTGDADSGVYSQWHHNANALILAAAREARAITVPSEWVAMPFKRDMRISPTVIGHGVEVDDWLPRPNQGYVLWNKNRPGDACSPLPAWELASAGIEVVSTFSADGKAAPRSMRVIGTCPHAQMKEWIQAADIYLATTKETFGIGTLEAMASGVPVLGYAWGGTLDLVEHGVTGWLVEPGDTKGLLEGLQQIRANRHAYSVAAMKAARTYTWDAAAAKYAAFYAQIAEEKRTEKRGVSVVITCYNYAGYVGQAIESCLNQRTPPDEIIVVDDGSTDDSAEVISGYEQAGKVKALYGTNQGVAAARNAGIKEASQPFIVCLDADDTLDPRYIKTLLPVMQQDRSLGIAYSGISLLWETGLESKAEWPPEFEWTAQAKPHNPPSNCIPCAAMFRRDMWQRSAGYQQVWAPGEDAEFWTRGLSLGFTAKRVTPEPLFKYRLHGGSASRTKTYKSIAPAHPWLTDRRYPMAAPAKKAPPVRSYSEPAVSVIVPVGPGHARYLPDALNSLLAQTCREWEVIVINDSGEALDNLTPYPFVRLFDTAGKEGAGKARNIGIEQAKAPLVLFLDADDWLQPDALEKMLKAHAETEGRYIYTGWLTLRGDGSAEEGPAKPYSQQEWLFKGQHAVTALVPAEWCKSIGGFDEDVVGWEDWDFFVKLAVAGYCGSEIEEPLLTYRLDTGNRRRDSFKHKEELLALLRERYSDYATGGKAMARCCGGSPAGQSILAARRVTREVVSMEEETQAAEQQAAGVPVPSNYVRMEFIGTREGAVTYSGPSGRSYRAGRGPAHRFIDVHKDDVDKLLGLGLFKVIHRAKEESAKAPQPAPKDLTQEERAAALQAVKEEALAATKEMAAVAESSLKGTRLKTKTGRGKRA